ncbi:MAG: glycoside hydrolase [Oscillatoriales cyanobacterium CG2_30_44_21]|nr:MAG: glycoside hydrolase [Oscillatoriales cyanobacterium CG2_30_44_21]
MSIGYLALVLHAHLPYVRHPESDYVLEEEWLYEAITETYIPLIKVYEGLRRDGIDFKMTMSMTPPLVSMLRDPLLQERYDKHLALLQQLVELEVIHNEHNGHVKYLAEYYVREFAETREIWERYDGDLISAFKQFQDTNNLEIITCGATHGYLPLMKMYPEAVWAQLEVAVEHYTQEFGRSPNGIWLPECAYYDGLERMLADVGLRYFLTDGHGLLYGQPRPRFGTYAPVFTETGVAAFARDHESSQQVWSSKVGYPGDPLYREFYKDLGWEADYEYIKPFVMPNGQRKNTGVKYHRITGRDFGLDAKQLYDPYWAKEKAAEHATNFMQNRQSQVGYLHDMMGRPPLVVSPYDAELFGHWWYEGPWFIDFLIRKSSYDQETFEMTHLADYLRDNPTQQVSRPAQSSWGYKGFHEYWLNETNAWVYQHLHKGAERMIHLSYREPADELEWRALNQAARELLLAQSSDWAFIMRTGTMVPYAIRRTRSHLMRLEKLFEDIESGKIDAGWLEKVEYMDNIFPDINYRTYRPLTAG